MKIASALSVLFIGVTLLVVFDQNHFENTIDSNLLIVQNSSPVLGEASVKIFYGGAASVRVKDQFENKRMLEAFSECWHKSEKSAKKFLLEELKEQMDLFRSTNWEEFDSDVSYQIESCEK